MKLLLTLVVGLLLGGVGTWWLLQEDAPSPQIVGPQTASQPTAKPAPTDPLLRDSPATFAELAQMSSAYQQTLALHQLLETKDASGVEDLLAQAKQQLEGDSLEAAAAILYGRLGELDPTRALQLVLREANSAQPTWLRAVFHAWARLDLDSARSAAQQLHNPLRQIAGRTILRSRQDISPAMQAEIVDEMSLAAAPIPRGSDFNLVWQKAMARPNLQQKRQGLIQLAALWASNDPVAAMQAAEALSDNSLGLSLQSQVAKVWAEQDPDAAVAWLESRQQKGHRDQLVQQVFQVLATADPIDAEQRARRLEGHMQELALVGVLEPMAAVNPEAAVALAGDLKSQNVRMHAVSTLASSLAENAPELAEEWVQSLSNDEAYIADFTVASVLTKSDPLRAASRVESMENTERRQLAVMNLVNNWVQQDVAAAASWIRTRPTEERGYLYQSLAVQWSSFDSPAAEAYIGELSSIQEKDQMRLGLLSNTLDKEQGQRLYEAMDDAQLKRQAAAQLYYQYESKDPEFAQQFREEATAVHAEAAIPPDS